MDTNTSMDTDKDIGKDLDKSTHLVLNLDVKKMCRYMSVIS